VTVVEGPAPLILCVGTWRPRILVSPPMLELLDEGELRAAVAHELSHVRWHDVFASWVLLAVRVVSAFNPVAQVLGRTVAWETELRADADAAAWTRRPAALASALLKVHGQPTMEAPGRLALSARLERARTFAIEARCRRLLDAPVKPASERLAFPFVAAGLALSALLFFVTS
jgi:Zn-dependent protease with chaperone function